MIVKKYWDPEKIWIHKNGYGITRLLSTIETSDTLNEQKPVHTLNQQKPVHTKYTVCKTEQLHKDENWKLPIGSDLTKSKLELS